MHIVEARNKKGGRGGAAGKDVEGCVNNMNVREKKNLCSMILP